jgi:hypothetical protein
VKQQRRRDAAAKAAADQLALKKVHCANHVLKRDQKSLDRTSGRLVRHLRKELMDQVFGIVEE